MTGANPTNLVLPEPLRDLASGEHCKTSEYVCELISTDQRQQRIERLRALVEQGLASGPATPDTAEDWHELDAIARGGAP